MEDHTVLRSLLTSSTSSTDTMAAPSPKKTRTTATSDSASTSASASSTPTFSATDYLQDITDAISQLNPSLTNSPNTSSFTSLSSNNLPTFKIPTLMAINSDSVVINMQTLQTHFPTFNIFSFITHVTKTPPL